MNPANGRVLLIIGVVVVVVAVVAHFALTAMNVQVFPHFSVFLGAIGVIVAAVGGYMMVSKSRSA